MNLSKQKLQSQLRTVGHLLRQIPFQFRYFFLFLIKSSLSVSDAAISLLKQLAAVLVECLLTKGKKNIYCKGFLQ